MSSVSNESHSGTGKTATFIIAMLSRVYTTRDYPQVLCLLPTYELAIQTAEVAAEIAQYSQIKIRLAVRGDNVPRGKNFDDHIIIGTPGAVLKLIHKQVFDIKKIHVFVFDEADVMIASNDHQEQCLGIHKQLPRECQTLLFSATYDSKAMVLAHCITQNPIVIKLKREQESLDKIKHFYIKCRTQNEKYTEIRNIYDDITTGQAIIFCQTRARVNWLADNFVEDRHSVAVLSTDLNVNQRLAVLDRFRLDLDKVLITTNVLSRGVDVENVDIVINYDLPVGVHGNVDCETYLHRIGRIGSFGGEVFNFIDSEQSMEGCRTIERHFQIKMNSPTAENSDEIEQIDS